jgi:hypothetical protein
MAGTMAAVVQPEVANGDPKKIVRAQTCEELHRWEFLRSRKHMGLPCNPTNPEV